MHTLLLLIIEYFKVTDRAELLQKQFEKAKITNECNSPDKDGRSLSPIPEGCTMDADLNIMKQAEGKPNLDNFVERKIIKVNQPPPPPRKKNINIKTEDHRVKGLKKNKKKSKKDKTDK